MGRLLVILGVGAALGAAAGATSGCGEPFVAAGASGASGGGGGGSVSAHTTTTVASASSTSAASTSTSASASSSSGDPACTPGTGVAPSSCGPDRYCDTSTGHCTSCSSLDRLQFGAAVPLGLTQPPGETEMFPRAVATTGDLFLVLQTMTPVYHTQIATAAANKPEGWMPPAPFAPLAGTNQDSGPLYLHDASTLAGLVDPSVAGAGEPTLLFDSDRISGKRKVFALLVGTMSIAVPVALSLPGGGSNESDIAVATAASPPRFFWLSDANGEPQRLVTALAMDGSPTDVALTLDNGCTAPLASTPWVTPGGEWLLFASTRPDATSGCAAPLADAPTHLYATRLDDSGNQMGTAAPIFDVTDPSLDNSPALLAPGQCSLVFSRFDANTGTGSLYAAQRN